MSDRDSAPAGVDVNAARARVGEIRRAIGCIVNCTEQSDQIDGLERLAIRALDKLAAEFPAVVAALETAQTDAAEWFAESQRLGPAVDQYLAQRDAAVAELARVREAAQGLGTAVKQMRRDPSNIVPFYVMDALSTLDAALVGEGEQARPE